MHEGRYESYTESVGTAIFLGALTLVIVAVAIGVVAWLNRGWTTASAARQPEVSPVARDVQPPPAPRLQISPRADMDQLRRSEDHVLERYGWVDEEAGVVRVPIERAMQLLVQEELGQ